MLFLYIEVFWDLQEVFFLCVLKMLLVLWVFFLAFVEISALKHLWKLQDMRIFTVYVVVSLTKWYIIFYFPPNFP